MSPFAGLLRSRKFWLAVSDAFFSTVTVLVTALVSPEHAELALLVVGIWQPVVVAVIAGIAYEDGAAKKNGNFLS